MNGILILTLLWITTVSCDFDIGEPCPEDEPFGVCTLFEKCQKAKDMRKNQQKIMYCTLENSVEVVCCPNESSQNPDIETTTSFFNKYGGVIDIIEMSFLEALQDGIFRSNRIVCRFDGNYPLKCFHQEYPTYTVDPNRQSTNCKITYPPIPESSLSPHLQKAWEACRNYSLEASLCIPSNNIGHYIRDDCKTQDTSVKIADGDPAEITQFPHMAVLGLEDSTQVTKKNKDIIWYGGGSLISEYFILTAGHVMNRDEDEVQYALLGATNKTDLKTGVMFQVVRIISYPDYQATVKRHDIAILELNRRVRFSEFIRPICLKVPGLQTTADRAIAGWGNIGAHLKDSTVLLKATIVEKPASVCKKEGSSRWFPETMLCAGSNTFGSGKRPDTCQGDSGGPLMARIRDLPCSYMVVGVVSWGPVCGKGKPGFYTDASKELYLKWITNIVWP